jgi:hypothetical protein
MNDTRAHIIIASVFAVCGLLILGTVIVGPIKTPNIERLP